MRVQLGAAGHQHSPVGIGLKAIPCEDTAGAPQTLEERGISLGAGRAPLLRRQLLFPGIYSRIWGVEPGGVLVP